MEWVWNIFQSKHMAPLPPSPALFFWTSWHSPLIAWLYVRHLRAGPWVQRRSTAKWVIFESLKESYQASRQSLSFPSFHSFSIHHFHFTSQSFTESHFRITESKPKRSWRRGWLDSWWIHRNTTSQKRRHLVPSCSERLHVPRNPMPVLHVS